MNSNKTAHVAISYNVTIKYLLIYTFTGMCNKM